MKIEKRLTTTITTLIVMTVGLIAGVGIPATMSIRSVGEQMLEENRQIENAYALRRLTSSTSELLADTHRRIAALDAMDVVEGDELAFISAIENAAADSDVRQELQLETVNQRDLNPWEKEVPLKLSADGEYRNLIVFLHKLETQPFYLVLRNLKISVPRQRETAAEGKAAMSMEATVRWRTKDHPAFIIPEIPSEER